MKKAVVLLSGGLDSATTLYLAKKEGFKCHCLIFDYGQRHRREIKAAKAIAQIANCKSQVIKIALPWKGSSLLDKNIKILTGNRLSGYPVIRRIPNTYVPGRNIIFLSFALSYAEAIKAGAIFIGANAVDFSGYPDCRPEFYRAFSKVIATGTKSGAEKRKIQIKTPLIRKTKAQIIRLGKNLGVPFALTWSCYGGGKRPCGICDSCYFRAKGFREAGIRDEG
jgi:7-cyano-7-deazaguanine synthase